MDDLETALAELRRAANDESYWTSVEARVVAVGTILNAAASGQLIPLETCNARAAAMVDAAAGEAAGEVAAHGAAELAPFVRRRVRALTHADAQAAMDAMISRAREEGESIGSTAYLRAIDVVEAALVNNPRHDAARRIAVGALRLLADPRAALRANATDASEGER